MTQSKILLAWCALLLGLSACDKAAESPTEPATKPKPTLSVSLSSTEMVAGESAPIKVSVAASFSNGLMSLTPELRSWSGADASAMFSVDFTPMPSSDATSFTTSSWTISSKASTPAGDYKLRVRLLENGPYDANQEVTFRVSESPVPVITGFGVDNASPQVSTSINSRGSVQFVGSKATVAYALSGCDGALFALPADFQVNSSPASIAKQIAIGPNADGVACSLTVSVTDERGRKSSQTTIFKVAPMDPGAPFVSIGETNLGAQRASPGSFLQFRGVSQPVTWVSGPGKPTEFIDVVFGGDSASVISLMSPVWANGRGFTLETWPTLNSTTFRDLGASMPQGLAEVEKAMLSDRSESVPAVLDHYYGIKMANGEYALLLIRSLNGSNLTHIATVELFLPSR